MTSDSRPEPLILVLFGPPGSGKGTQAQMLAEKFGLVHLATGDLLRLEIRNQTPLGLKAEAVIQSGRLVSDDLVQTMLGVHMLRALEAGQSILLDGFPRTLPQLEFLTAFFGEHDYRLGRVLNLVIALDRLIERLGGRRVCRNCGHVYHVAFQPPLQDGVCNVCGGPLYQRPDDTRESIVQRMAVYTSQTQPVLAAMEREGIVLDIDADAGRDEVYEHLAEAVRLLQAGGGSASAGV